MNKTNKWGKWKIVYKKRRIEMSVCESVCLCVFVVLWFLSFLGLSFGCLDHYYLEKYFLKNINFLAEMNNSINKIQPYAELQFQVQIVCRQKNYQLTKISREHF